MHAIHRTLRPGFLALLAVAAAGIVQAEGPYRNRDNRNAERDPGEGTYPVPYQRPTEQEITAALTKIRSYLETAAPLRVVDRRTGAEITEYTKPVADAIVDRGEENAFFLFDYTNGPVHTGMMLAAEVTGDRAFAEYTARHLQFIHDRLPYFETQQKQFNLGRRSSYRGVLDPESLDDCGAMAAAFIRARRANLGPDMMPIIERWTDHVARRQFRLSDGTLARQRPQAQSIWADDAYMGIPVLAEMGRLTGDTAWYDDAVKNILQMSERLFRPDTGLYTHGWNAHHPDAPEFYWGRANGWVVLTLCDVLDILPENHAGREAVLAQLRAVLKGLSRYQSGTGLWHQMVDRNDSYLETSASAMFVYGLAHAINRGWIDPTTYGSIALAGWAGLSTRINERGQVEGTCVGTTFASDQVYYYHRPANAYATHGYGPMLLAGAEMIKLLRNPEIEIQHRVRTYHFVPKSTGGPRYGH